MKRNGKILSDTLKKSRAGAAATALCFAVSAAIFSLYGLPAEPFLYAMAVIVFAELVLFAAVWARETARARERERMISAALTEEELPEAHTLAEQDYQELIRLLKEELTGVKNQYEARRQDEVDYYTAWVHQIKTPIAVMRMELGDGETANARALEAELFRVEQYADMVLTYIRLGSATTDLVIREYPLDELIRESVRKFAPQFVARRLRLCYEGIPGTVITDKKWFSCILEQLLSNAVKYTPSGSVTVTREGELLKISDTGIGIAPEDLPRIFEKGFTGQNGRLDKRSSGLGLYLCRRAADLLDVPLTVESAVGPGGGSTFIIDLTGKLRS